MPKQAQTEILAGARDVVPLAVGVALYGTAFGLLAAQAGLDELQVGVMGALVFGGASQIVAVERVAAGAGALAAITAGFALNLRLLLITASIREVYADRPAWQIALGAHFTSDESWALMLAQRARGRDAGYWYLVGAGAGLLVTWLVATVGGVFFAAAIPEPRALGMDFAFTAAFHCHCPFALARKERPASLAGCVSRRDTHCSNRHSCPIVGDYARRYGRRSVGSLAT